MKCPHCIVEVNPNFQEIFLNSDKEGHWSVFYMKCPNPNCGKYIIDLALGKEGQNPNGTRSNRLGKLPKGLM